MTTSIPTVQWVSDNLGQGPLWIARHTYNAGNGWGMHQHDFAELFWIESGSGWHQLNGDEHVLRVGDVVCLRPADRHASRAGADGLAVVNVSFLPRAVSALANRHRKQWPWHHLDPAARRTHLAPARMERLHAWTAELSRRRTQELDLECFLMEVMRLFNEPAAAETVGFPAWLAEALAVFSDPVHLAGGVPQLAHLAGRGIDHLNRVVRHCTGATATALVTGLRLDYAASELRLSDRPIAQLAEAVGLPNLGHFYRLFHQRFGTTPDRYRRAARQYA
jgi:AraC family cel operon transcriptional repressor